MPADNGSGCHLDERFLPSSPAPSQYDPEQLVCRSESPARALGVKSEQLLTQGKIFEDEILAGPECTNNPAEEVPEPYDHAQNLTGTLPIELGAKSLILRVYDVLMNDTYTFAQINLSLSFFVCDTVADHTFRVVRQPTGMLVAYRRIIERCSTTRFMQPPVKDTISDSANDETSTQGRSPFRKAGSATASFLSGACRPLRRRCGRGPQ